MSLLGWAYPAICRRIADSNLLESTTKEGEGKGIDDSNLLEWKCLYSECSFVVSVDFLFLRVGFSTEKVRFRAGRVLGGGRWRGRLQSGSWD